jgi:maleate isomerase
MEVRRTSPQPERGHFMKNRILLGMLTPSSNTALEPLTSAMVSALPGVSAHFSRFTVTEISLRDQALGQFDDSKVLEAAKLLADAKVDVIGWSGTSSGWLGFEADERLCRRITEATGIPATTSVLALNEILGKTGVDDFGLVTPYLADVQQKIVANYARLGIACRTERHLDLHVNFSFSEVGEDQIRALVREVARDRPQAISTFCTNLRAAHLVQELEAETGIPVYDTVSAVVWKALRIAGVDTRQVKGWGRLFEEVV